MVLDIYKYSVPRYRYTGRTVRRTVLPDRYIFDGQKVWDILPSPAALTRSATTTCIDTTTRAGPPHSTLANASVAASQ